MVRRDEGEEMSEESTSEELVVSEPEIAQEIETSQAIALREREQTVEPTSILPSPSEWEATMTMARTIAGTTFVSFTVSSCSEATSRSSTWSPDCVPRTDGSRAHGVNF